MVTNNSTLTRYEDSRCQQAYDRGVSDGYCRSNIKIQELENTIAEMKRELHHRLVSPSKNDTDCLDKIIGLDRLWQFGKEF